MAIYIRNAEKRGYDFNLSEDEFKLIISKNCFYCGSGHSNSFESKARLYQPNGPFSYNGIDRLENEKGYIKGNCVPCCKDCNKMKMDMNFSDFIDKVNSIYNFKLKSQGSE